MPLSWNEIKTRAVAFSNKWKDEQSEDAEAKSFCDDLFNVFGILHRRVVNEILSKYQATEETEPSHYTIDVYDHFQGQILDLYYTFKKKEY